MIVVLKFRTEVAFSEENNFRQIMEAFLQREISYSETGKRLSEPHLEEVASALGALFVLAQRKEPGFELKVYPTGVARKWYFGRPRNNPKKERSQP